MYVLAWICVPPVHVGVSRGKKASYSLELELEAVGAAWDGTGNWTLVLYKSIKPFETLSFIFSRDLIFLINDFSNSKSTL